MATVVTRKHKSGEQTFKVQWLLGGGRGAPWPLARQPPEGRPAVQPA